MKRLLAGAGLVACVLLGVPPVADAQTAAPSLGGFQGTAAASGLQVEYTPQGALPIPSLVDIGSPDAVATISSGPATFAQASILDPGDLLANPDALLTLLSSDYPSGTVPAYPYRIAANSGFGEPAAESTAAPGLTSSVRAESAGSTARASAPAAQAVVANIGSLSALATTRTDGSSVTVHAVSKASNVVVAGLIAFDSIVTDLTATSKGAETTLTGGTKLTGAKIAGRAVTIDGNGVHLAKSALPLPKALGKSLNTALKRAGIEITLAAPVPSSSPTSGRLASGGLRIDFKNSSRSVPALAALFDAIPTIPSPVPGAPSPDDLLVALQVNNVAGVEFGRGLVSLTGRVAAAPLDEVLPDVSDLGADLGGFDLTPIPSVGSLLPSGGLAPSLRPTRPVGSTTAPVSPFGAGIGGLLLVALLLQPFLGKALAQLSQGVLGSGGADECPWEGQ